MHLKNLEKILTEYGQTVVDDYKAALKERGYKIAETVTTTVDIAGTKYYVIINLAEYWKYIEHGRRAGAKMPPEKPIIEWIRRKGIEPRDKRLKEKQFAFIIRKSISEKGIAPKPFLAESLKKNRNIVDEIETAFKVDIYENLANELKI